MAIKPKLIQDDYYAGLLSDFIGGSTLVTYYIGSAGGISIDTEELTEISSRFAQPFAEFARSVFLSIDQVISLDFVETTNPADAQIELYSVSSFISPDDTDTLGYAINRPTSRDFVAFWKDTGETNNDQNTIIHEIGHTVGLGHPGVGATPSKEDPDDLSYSTDDTVMSYNEGSNGWATKYTESDLAALLALWGPEESIVTTSQNDSLVFSDSHDELTGTKGNEDLFIFESTPNYTEPDTITNFSTRDYDAVQIAISSFDLYATPSFKVAKNHNALTKLLKSTTSFVYEKYTGGLYFNENGKLAGYGEQGGIFLLFDDRPTLLKSSIYFV